jgi:hypothetical protein
MNKIILLKIAVALLAVFSGTQVSNKYPFQHRKKRLPSSIEPLRFVVTNTITAHSRPARDQGPVPNLIKKHAGDCDK